MRRWLEAGSILVRPWFVYLLVSACAGVADETPVTQRRISLECVQSGSSKPEWRASHDYSRGDRVAYQGDVYECVEGHRSTSSEPPSARADLWLLPSGCALSTWREQTDYEVGSVVELEGRRYRATKAHASSSETRPGSSDSADLWTLLDLVCPPDDPAAFTKPDLPAAISGAGTSVGQFGVSLSGASTYRVAIDVSRGRGGLQPALEIVYRSDGGDGLLGLGASLQGLSEVSRCTMNLSDDGQLREVRFDEFDPLCLDGARLTPIASSGSEIEYRTRPDTFRKVIAYFAPEAPELGPRSFRVYSKDGQIAEYGGRPRSLPESDEYTSRVMAKDGVVARWALSRVRDRSGNYMDFSYINVKSSSGDGGSTTKYMPAAIRYTGHVGADGETTDLLPERSVEFKYEQPRFYHPDRYAHGLHLLAPDLISRIDVNGPQGLIHSYHLGYSPGGSSIQTAGASVTHRDRLIEIADLAADGSRKLETKLVFGTPGTTPIFQADTAFVPNQTGFSRFDISPNDAVLLPFTVVADIDGNGLDEIIAFTRRFSGASGTEEPIQNRVRILKQRALASPQAPNVVHQRGRPAPDTLSFIPSGDPITWNGRAIEEAVPVDYDGDGDRDLMVVEQVTGFTGTKRFLKVMESRDGTLLPAVATPFELPGVVGSVPFFTDVSGDGQPDLIVCEGNSWSARIWQGGNSPFGGNLEIAALQGSPCTLGQALENGGASSTNAQLYQNAPYHFAAIDVNGDGAQDLLVPSGNDYSAPVYAVSYDWSTKQFGPTRATGLSHLEIGSFRALDLNGDGLSDLVSLSKLPTGPDDQVSLAVRFNTGDGFELAPEDASRTYKNRDLLQSLVLDADGDGRADLAIPGSDGFWEILSWQTPSPTNGVQQPSFLRRATSLSTAAAVKNSLLRFATPFHPNSLTWIDLESQKFVVFDNTTDPVPDLLTAVHDQLGSAGESRLALGHIDGIQYSFMHAAQGRVSDGESGYRGDSGCVYPLACPRGYRPLVSRYSALNGNNDNELTEIAYSEARVDLLGRGWLGFGRVRMSSQAAPKHTEIWQLANTTFDGPERFPRAGQVTDHWSFGDPGADGEGVHTHLDYERSVRARPSGAETFSYWLRKRRDERVSKVRLDDPEQPDPNAFATTTTVFEPFSANGVPDEAGNLGTITVTSPGLSRKLVTTLQYDQEDLDQWLVGLATDLKTVSTELVDGVEQQQTRHLRIMYDAGSVSQLILAPGDSDRQLWTSYTRDAYGNVTLVSTTGNENGEAVTRQRCTNFDTHELNFPTVTSNALGHVVRTKFDRNLGLPLQRLDANGLTTRWAYDGFGRIAKELRPDDSFTRVIRGLDVLGATSSTVDVVQTERVVDSNGHDIEVQYDNAGRIVRSLSFRLGRTDNFETRVQENWSYDATGQISSHTFPHDPEVDGITDQFEHDGLGRLVAQRRGDRTLGTATYSGLLTSVVDARGHSTVITRDGAGRVTQQTDAMNGIVVYSYGPFDQIVSVKDPLASGEPGHEHSLTRDAYGFPSQSQSGDEGQHTLSFSAFGQLTTDSGPGTSKTFHYDLLGRPTSLVDEDGTTSWSWDGAAHGIGRLQSVNGPQANTALSFGFDEFARPSSVTTQLGNSLATIRYVYDDSEGHARLHRVVYPDEASQFEVEYQYDARGNANLISDVATGAIIWSATEADAMNRITKDGFGNDVLSRSRVYDFDHDGVLKELSTTAGGEVVQHLSYGYDANNNLISRWDHGRWRWHNEPVTDQVETFCYDQLDRLTTVDSGSTTCAGALLQNSYSADGNLDSKSDVGTYVYDETHRHAVKTVGLDEYTYDARGNQITRPRDSDEASGQSGTKTLRYSALNLPLSYLAGNVTSWTGSSSSTTAICPGESPASGSAASDGPLACLIGTESLAITDGTVVHTDAATQSLDIGVGARIDGDVAVAGSATLRDRASITGSLDISGTLQRSNGASVGHVNVVATANVPRIPRRNVAPGSGWYEVPNGVTRSIAPGQYGEMMVRARSRVTFTAGSYDLAALRIEPSTKVTFDTSAGPINLNVKGTVTLDGPIDFGATDAVKVALYSDGCEVTLAGNIKFPGTITAPHATVVTRSGATINGCVWGRIVQIGPHLDNAVASKAVSCSVQHVAVGQEITCSDNATLFSYDGLGNRIAKSDRTQQVLYAGGLYQRIKKFDSGAITHKYYVPTPTGLAAVYNRTRDPNGNPVGADTWHYLLSDHLGSLDVVTDEQGTAIDRRSYDAFGKRRGQRSNVPTTGAAEPILVGFAGHEDDAELGLVNMRGRIYDPKIARFLSADPFKNTSFSQGLNPYSYVYNNPLSWLDPSGFAACGLTAQSEGFAEITYCRSGDTPTFSIPLESTGFGGNNFGWGDLSRIDAGPMADAFNQGTDKAIDDLSQKLVHTSAGALAWEVSPAATLFLTATLADPDPANAPIHGQPATPRPSAAARALNLAIPVVIGGVAAGMAKGPAAAAGSEGAEIASILEGGATRGPASGARIVSPPGPGQVIRGSITTPVFEGHGTTAPGSFTVPQGTWLQVPHATIVAEEAAQAAAMNGSFPGGTARVIPPGGIAPNLVLHPPTPGMSVRPTSWQVTRPTLLRDVLEPDMGFCVWGACQ